MNGQQLDIFTSLERGSEAVEDSHPSPGPTPSAAAEASLRSKNSPRCSQMTELAGKTWEDAFGRKEAA